MKKKAAQVDLKEILEALLGKYDTLEARIRNIDFCVNDPYPRISVRGSYLAFRDGLPTMEDFVNVVHRRITTFCLPRQEVGKIYNLAISKSPDEAAELWTATVTRASEKYIKAKKGTHRSGEATEIILFILLEWIIKAPQIVSKMYLKTNNNMPVHGTDGIHARFDAAKGELYIYWGESKAHKNLSSAFNDAMTSLGEFIEMAKEEKEIDIIHSHADFGDMTQQARTILLDFFDPIKEQSNKRKPVFACLLVFEQPSLQEVIEHEKTFVEEFRSLAENFITSLKDRLDEHNLFPRRFEFFLLPLDSVQRLRDLFQQKIGWPK